jgi:type IV pilus assembly protein PilV
MLTASLSSSKGFTLVEVLMAMLIMTVGLLGLLQSVNVAYEHNVRNRLREEAVLIGEEKMNDFRLYPSLYAAFNPITTVDRAIGGMRKKFTVTKDCQPIGGNSNQLRVSVRWAFKNATTAHEIYTIKKM